MPQTQTQANLQGKVVIVTGGGDTSKRIGEEVVNHGGRVALIGREAVADAANELRQIKDAEVIAYSGVDLRDPIAVKKAVHKVIDLWDSIDYIISATSSNFVNDFHHLSSTSFKSVVDIDNLGARNVIEACVDQLMVSSGGVVLVSAAVHSYGVQFQVPVHDLAGGVDKLVEVLSPQLRCLGVRCNGMMPLGEGGSGTAAKEAVKLLMSDGTGVVYKIKGKVLQNGGDSCVKLVPVYGRL